MIASTLLALDEQGVRIHLVDNWSDDDTVARAEALGLGDRLTVERFPHGGPSGTYDWEALLRHTEELAATLDTDWVDPPGRRRDPARPLGGRDAPRRAAPRGRARLQRRRPHRARVPPHRGLAPSRPATTSASTCATSSSARAPATSLQVKAWSARAARRVELAASGGHDADFPGRRVFPYKFLLLHYPVRSQELGGARSSTARRPTSSPTTRPSTGATSSSACPGSGSSGPSRPSSSSSSSDGGPSSATTASPMSRPKSSSSASTPPSLVLAGVVVVVGGGAGDRLVASCAAPSPRRRPRCRHRGAPSAPACRRARARARRPWPRGPARSSCSVIAGNLPGERPAQSSAAASSSAFARSASFSLQVVGLDGAPLRGVLLRPRSSPPARGGAPRGRAGSARAAALGLRVGHARRLLPRRGRLRPSRDSYGAGRTAGFSRCAAARARDVLEAQRR